MPTGPDRAFLKGAYEAMRARAAGMAKHLLPGYDAKELDGDELEAVWNERAMPLEAEWELHRARADDGVTPRYTPEQIGLLVFPKRERLAKAGGRVEPAEFIGWTNQTAKRMAERRAKRQAMLEGGVTDGLGV